MGILKNIGNLFKRKRRVLSPDEFKEAIETTELAQVMDVRMITEYRKGHIPGAFYNDMYLDEFYDKCDGRFEKDRPLFIYCRRGKRSEVIAQKLRERGYKEIYELEGGYVNYNA